MVFSAGNVLTASGLNDATLSGISTYTPTVANGGTATFTTRTGWYYKIGSSHIVFMCAYVTVNASGSGATDVTITAPSNIDRTTRQVMDVDFSDGTNYREGNAVSLITGSGAVIDKLRITNATAVGSAFLSGSGLNAGSVLTVQGWYREA